MKKLLDFFAIVMIAFFITACDENACDNQECYIPGDTCVLVDSEYVYNPFVYVSNDTCIDEYTYGKFIPSTKVGSSILVDGNYVCFNDDDSCAVIFSPKYIWEMCLNSKCVFSKISSEDSCEFTEFTFPGANLGFLKDCDEFIVYAWIYFQDKYWYSYDDYIFYNIGNAMDKVLEYLDDSIIVHKNDNYLQFRDIPYRYNYLPSYNSYNWTKSIPLWDIVRSFYSHPMSEGIIKDNFISYTNEVGLTFLYNNQRIIRVFTPEFTVADFEIYKLENILLYDLKKIPLRYDIVLEPLDTIP